MHKGTLTQSRTREDWRPLAYYLVARFASGGTSDERVHQARTAVAAVHEAERRYGSERPDFVSLAVPLILRELRRNRREQIYRRPLSAIQLAITAADEELGRRLRRSPTVAEVAAHLDLAQHQVVAGLEAGWAAGI